MRTAVYFTTRASPTSAAPRRRAAARSPSTPSIQSAVAHSIKARAGTSAVSVDAETRNAGDASQAAVAQVAAPRKSVSSIAIDRPRTRTSGVRTSSGTHLVARGDQEVAAEPQPGQVTIFEQFYRD